MSQREARCGREVPHEPSGRGYHNVCAAVRALCGGERRAQPARSNQLQSLGGLADTCSHEREPQSHGGAKWLQHGVDLGGAKGSARPGVMKLAAPVTSRRPTETSCTQLALCAHLAGEVPCGQHH
jgi:hypothetical protein